MARPQAAAPPSGRFSGGYVGLYPEDSLELTTGRCEGCLAPQEGLWYFLDEVIAVPKAGAPAIVWIGSTQLVEGATLSRDGRSLTLADGSVVSFELVPKLSTNLSYYDLSTTAFLRGRKLRLRGEFVEEGGVRRFVARTVWPEDFRVDFQAPSLAAKGEEDITALVTKDDGGARTAFKTTVLWERAPPEGRAWAGRPVMGAMLNGAQGDDDETHGGHFSAFTGRLGPEGEMADWMFDNFYDMDQVSEKGILPAMVPMDKYLADVNSGQSWYRPTDMLVLVLSSDRLALQLQERFKDLYARYYAHEVKYNRTTKSCARTGRRPEAHAFRGGAAAGFGGGALRPPAAAPLQPRLRRLPGRLHRGVLPPGAAQPLEVEGRRADLAPPVPAAPLTPRPLAGEGWGEGLPRLRASRTRS